MRRRYIILICAVSALAVFLTCAAVLAPPIEGDWVLPMHTHDDYFFLDLRDGHGIAYGSAGRPTATGKYQKIGRRTYRFEINPFTGQTPYMAEVGWFSLTLYEWAPGGVREMDRFVRDLHIRKRKKMKRKYPDATHEKLYEEMANSRTSSHEKPTKHNKIRISPDS